MSTYVLMRILESAPRRYDLGIRLLTLGSLDGSYDRLTNRIADGQQVLDIGCGTGALTLRAARRGAKVKAIDVNPQMLEIAEQQAREQHLAANVEFKEMSVAELDGEEPETFDVVMSSLCFSELSDDELIYTLGQARRILKPGGLLLVADEVRPRGFVKRLLYAVIRLPLAAFTYIVTQQSTRAVEELPAKVSKAGLPIESVRLSVLGSFMELMARKPGEVRS